MTNMKEDLYLTGDSTRNTRGFLCSSDLHTAIKMAARKRDMTKSDIIRRLFCNFLYDNINLIDGIESEAGSKLLNTINTGKKDYDRVFNISNKKESDNKKDVSSFDLTDIDNLL